MHVDVGELVTSKGNQKPLTALTKTDQKGINNVYGCVGDCRSTAL